jgi:hypothetical protein
MSSQHLELIAEAHADANVDELRQRLSHQGVQTLPMKVGFLLSGAPSALRAIVPELTGQEQGAVEVPQHLRDVVKAIYVVRPRSLME